MNLIHLNINSGYRWFSDNNGLQVKGFMIDGRGVTWADSELITLLKKKSVEELILIANKTSGSFCLIKEYTNQIFALVDKTRSFPLLWTLNSRGLKISDTLSPKFDYKNRKLVKHSALEFMFTNYVTGNQTLYDGIYSLPGAHYLVYNKDLNTISLKPYYVYKHEHLERNTSKLLTGIEPLHLKVFDRYFRAAGTHRIVVPLSGGYDSRLIVRCLAQLGYKNVLCFTYGTLGNTESKISKGVAAAYGFKWVFVEYTPEKWRALLRSRIYKRYIDFASRGISLPLPQDFLAILELKKRGILKSGDVIIPGHTGDFVESGHLPSTFMINKKFGWADILSAILHKHYDQWRLKEERLAKLFGGNLKKTGIFKSSYTREEIGDTFERWDWLERQCKYIINSVRTYEFFNFKWMLPFWDNDILDFWSRVPIDWRIGRRLYLKYEYGKSSHIGYISYEILRVTKKLCHKTHTHKLIVGAINKINNKASRLENDRSGQVPKGEIEKYKFIAKNTLAIKSKSFIQERFPKDFGEIYKKITEYSHPQ